MFRVQNDNYKKDTHDPSKDDPIKIIHKEQDIIAAFCLNQVTCYVSLIVTIFTPKLRFTYSYAYYKH